MHPNLTPFLCMLYANSIAFKCTLRKNGWKKQQNFCIFGIRRSNCPRNHTSTVNVEGPTEKPFRVRYDLWKNTKKTATWPNICEFIREKPYSCETCGKAFAQKSDLICHVQAHTGDKSFVCKFCGRRVAQSSIRSTHQKLGSATS